MFMLIYIMDRLNRTKEKEEYKTMWVDNIDSIEKRLFTFDKK